MSSNEKALRRPGADECVDYYKGYISKAKSPVLTGLAQDGEKWQAQLHALSPEQERHRYAPGKWSLREVVGHVIDTERVFAVRALAFARCDSVPWPGFDQDEYNAASGADNRPVAQLAAELAAVRGSTLLLFAGFGDESWDRRGIASGNEFTVRSLAWIMAGHSRHHRKVVEERYLASGGR